MDDIEFKITVIKEFGEELKNSVKAFLHPHIDGVVEVTIQRVKKGFNINSNPKGS